MTDYVHGYHPRENERLADQANTLVELLHSDTAYAAGSAVLEAGCGVGAQTVKLPPFPIELNYLWRAFCRLRQRKGSSGYGVPVIEWADIDAFCRLTGARLAPWEVDVIERLDDTCVAKLLEQSVDVDATD